MTERADRPWWASDGPVDGGVDRRVDAMDAVRAARRPRDVTELPAWLADPAAAPGPHGDLVEDRDDGVRERADQPPPVDRAEHARAEHALADTPAHDPSVCGVCPICIALRTLQESRPDLVRHLGEAARHLAAAARSLMDPAASDPTRPRDRRPSDPPGLRRIHLDVDDADEPSGQGAPIDDPEGRA